MLFYRKSARILEGESKIHLDCETVQKFKQLVLNAEWESVNYFFIMKS